VDVVAVAAADSLVAAMRAMDSSGGFQLVVRDSFPHGFAFSPIKR
jgi:hypothetical protein